MTLFFRPAKWVSVLVIAGTIISLTAQPANSSITSITAVSPRSSSVTTSSNSKNPDSVEPFVTSPETTTWHTYLPQLARPLEVQNTTGWSMAGANPQRTSWTSEQVPSAAYLAAHRNDWLPGMLYPQWYKPFDAYIPHKVQIVGANDLLYVSTARGLYALGADAGDLRWVYATEMPLGHSPTIYNGNAYVGGYDHKLHAVAANPDVSQLPLQPDSSGQNVRINNQVLWTFEAEAGFETNPLVVNNTVYAGNRDGFMYAVDASNGNLLWKFKTGGPILFSAAASRDNSRIYFASNDAHAYAVNAQTGEPIWKSAKLPGAGFHSWWPVIYLDLQTQKEYVLLAGSHSYRDNVPPGPEGRWKNMENLDRELWQGAGDYGDGNLPTGTLMGVLNSNKTIDAGARNPNAAMSVKTYYQNKPWRRTYFVFDALTGVEQSYAPFLWMGSQSGNRFPSVIGNDNKIYQTAGLYYGPYINRAGILGWNVDSSNVTTPESEPFVVDEPVYSAAGGNLVYWSRHSDTGAGVFDLSVPNQNYLSTDNRREWIYWAYSGPDQLFPNYDGPTQGRNFGGQNGSYGRNGDGNPPIPYRGKVFLHKGNAVLALGTTERSVGTMAATARVVSVSSMQNNVNLDALKAALNAEIQKMISAGHLRPGFVSSGHIDGDVYNQCGDVLLDYFHNPADTLWALSSAMPYLTPDVAQSTKTYLQSEFATYNPESVTHIGWRDGASRDWFDLPPDLDADRVHYPPTEWTSNGFVGWGQPYGTNIPPYAFYATWKYAQAANLSQSQVKAWLNSARSRLDTSPPSDSVLQTYPFVHNAYIAGYQGYLALQAMAGETENGSIRTTLDNLLAARAANFTVNAGSYPLENCRAFNTSRNWMWMTPELAQYLHDHALAKVQAAVDEYQRITPYWFVASFPDTVGEAIHQPMYDVLLLQAKAQILKQPAGELVKYLDVPGFARGDLFYIQNLVSIIDTLESP